MCEPKVLHCLQRSDSSWVLILLIDLVKLQRNLALEVGRRRNEGSGRCSRHGELGIRQRHVHLDTRNRKLRQVARAARRTPLHGEWKVHPIHLLVRSEISKGLTHAAPDIHKTFCSKLEICIRIQVDVDDIAVLECHLQKQRVISLNGGMTYELHPGALFRIIDQGSVEVRVFNHIAHVVFTHALGVASSLKWIYLQPFLPSYALTRVIPWTVEDSR